MKKFIVVAMLFAAAAIPAASAASKHKSAAPAPCYSPADIEAEQALMAQSFVMVLSSACRQDINYGEFKVRNRDALIGYQQEMIEHFRRAGARKPDKDYESWITRVANQTATEHAGLPSAETCAQSAEMLKLDPPGFREYVQAHAVKAADTHPACRGK